MAPFFDPQPTPLGGLDSPSTHRNRDPILDVLKRVLPTRGLVLEIASGTGQHAAYFAAALPHLLWQPSDMVPKHLQSIAAWRAQGNLPNLLVPVAIDVEQWPWPIEHADAVVNINMIHIAPWSACAALMRGAAAVLGPGSPLFLYGPFKRGGAHTAPSNEAFDERLRAEDPAWGVRDLDEVAQLAAEQGFTLSEIVAMPANNLSIIFMRHTP